VEVEAVDQVVLEQVIKAEQVAALTVKTDIVLMMAKQIGAGKVEHSLRLAE
jgi:hypothetical protein